MGAYSRRDFLKGSLAAGAGVAMLGSVPRVLTAQSKEPIKIGVLHSLSGTMAISGSRCATSC
jgi:urea transport system substrate-binding protein